MVRLMDSRIRGNDMWLNSRSNVRERSGCELTRNGGVAATFLDHWALSPSADLVQLPLANALLGYNNFLRGMGRKSSGVCAWSYTLVV